MSSQYVRSFENRMERAARPQEPARLYNGNPVTHTGLILPPGAGGYRHGFSGGCGCGLGATNGSNSTSLAIVFLVFGGVLAYALLRS